MRSIASMGTILIGLVVVGAGCQPAVHFPAAPVANGADGALRAYDANRDGRADFFLYADDSGRINRIGYDLTCQGKPDEVVNLDEISFQRCRHLVIILDGFGYDVVKAYYDAGGLRMFYPPSRVIAPYPTMTDTSLEDVLNFVPCAGYEEQYFDQRTNRLVGGAGRYLLGDAQSYNGLIQYRAKLIWDAIGYVFPWPVFGKEINDATEGFEKDCTQEYIAYFVSSAGVSTQQGAEGQKRCLARVEQMINQAIWQSNGLVKVTMFADHGHSYTPSRMVPLEGYLKSKGWRLRKKLTRDNDVVWVRFGLVTCASFGTRRPASLAADLVGCEGVQLASYVDGDSVVVLSDDGGQATIRRKGDRYSYQVARGDPLKLKDVLPTLKADSEGYYDANEMLAATADREFPAPLERLWRAHLGLVENPTVVLCSLKDNYYSGSAGFAGAVKVCSTHGSLNRRNSTTFIMSTAGPLPALMRSREVSAAMSKLIGGPWPMRK